jgi:CRP-like cAMP-binding protein
VNGLISINGRRVPCEKCPLRGLPCLREFTPDELAFISEFKLGEVNAEPGATVLFEGTKSAHLYTVLSGWAFRYKMLPDGRRQILNYALPADLIGLQGTLLNEMQHSVEALTDLVLCILPRDKLWELYANYPSLAFDVTWLASRQERIGDEHLLSVGRRSALERTAFLLLHLFLRAEQLRLNTGNRIPFPLTQQHVADTLGMSLVHTNKTLKRLAETQTVRWKGRILEIRDRERLAEIANYEGADTPPRPLI